MDENGPHRPIGRGTIRTHGLVGVVFVGGNVLQGGFKVSETQSRPTAPLFLLDVELTAPL